MCKVMLLVTPLMVVTRWWVVLIIEFVIRLASLRMTLVILVCVIMVWILIWLTKVPTLMCLTSWLGLV